MRREEIAEPVSKLVHVGRDDDVGYQLGDEIVLPSEAMVPERHDGGERVGPLAKIESSGDGAELGDMDGVLRDSAERSEGDDRLLSNRERGIGVGVSGGGGSWVNELDDEIGPGTSCWAPIGPVIWRETGVRVVVVAVGVVLSGSVSERRRRVRRARVGTVGGSGGKRQLTISCGRSSTVGRRK